MLRTIIAFAIAVVVGIVAGAISLGLLDQAAYEATGGAALGMGERLSWLGATLYGLVFIDGTGLGMGLYPLLVLIGLLIGLIVAAVVKRIAPGLRFWWYAGAGAVAMITIVLALKMAIGMMVLPGARTAMGIAGQGVAGFLAGAAFAAFSRKR